MSIQRFQLNRRKLLAAFAAGAATAAVGGLWSRRSRAASNGPCFLIVIPCFGGGAIIDSLLPVKESETTDPTQVDCHPDAEVKDISGSPIRAVDAIISSAVGLSIPPTEVALSPLVDKHKADMMVTTLQATSVNHTVAQHRALTGGGSAWSGRTLQEVVAATYGQDHPIPNVNMASLGYLLPGDDPTLPKSALAEPVAQPLLYPLSLSAHRGIKDTPAPKLINMARDLRDNKLDPGSSFYQTFRLSERLKLWSGQREAARLLEDQELINKLIFIEDNPPNIPLSEFDLTPGPETALLNQLFPDILGGGSGALDPFEQQAALAYLMLKHGVSVTVTISPDLSPIVGGPTLVKNPPLAFDGSHNDHHSAQAIMWQRVLGVADKLVDLLKATPFGENGETMWDRTMIHFPTDFGRGKRRPAGQPVWGTPHNLNNGTLTISPLVNGNTVLGGVVKNDTLDTDCHTYGFNLQTGAEDPSRTTAEAEHYAGLLQALGIDTSPAGLPDVPAMRKGS